MTYQKYIYVGCRTTQKRHAIGKGISVYGINEQGNWDLVDISGNLENPSFLTLDKSRKFLYAIHGDFGDITAFKILADGKLEQLNTITLDAKNPVHVVVSENNRFLIVPFLTSGDVYTIERDVKSGELLGVASHKVVAGLKENTVSHPHQICFDGTQKRIIVPCQGRDAGQSKLVVYDFNEDTGKLIEIFERTTRLKAEARHAALHPNGKFLYVVSEHDSTIAFYVYDELKGTMIPIQILSTMPDTKTGDCWASGVAMDNEGKYIYVSNRADNSITWYSINQRTGYLTLIDNVSCLGVHPRFITLGPAGKHLYIANKNTHTICRYTRDGQGNLIEPKLMAETGSPTCVAFSWIAK
ncbi:lactonase family protein [Secundilactobacillus collinoides]|nr:lactonase family protein [Secundilactobacillus collinoides]KZL38925.1 hypothetical protein TY91_11500 [Secundilactobacillus collinoides]